MGAYIQANTNGRLHSADEPSISPLNRGFLYGDAIYEVWRTYDGTVFAWEEHWERLQRSADALFFRLSFSADFILEQIRRTVAEYRRHQAVLTDVYIRLQISRGAGPIGLDTALADEPFFVLLVQENKLYSDEKFAAGLQLSFAREMRRNTPDALNPAWKTGNYLNNILCLREARARGADEVVICNQHEEITEAAVSNIAFVRDGTVVTPPLDAGILAGITRKLLVETIAPTAKIPLVERAIRPDELGETQECFLLSTTKDITPVARIDDRRFNTGSASVTLRLKNEFANYVREYVRRRPELKLP